MKGNADDNVAKQLTVLPPSLPPPLPSPASATAAISRSRLPDRQAWSSKGSGPFEAKETLKPVCGDAVAQWLRPIRNLRRAIVVATILGRPPH